MWILRTRTRMPLFRIPLNCPITGYQSPADIPGTGDDQSVRGITVEFTRKIGTVNGQLWPDGNKTQPGHFQCVENPLQTGYPEPDPSLRFQHCYLPQRNRRYRKPGLLRCGFDDRYERIPFKLIFTFQIPYPDMRVQEIALTRVSDCVITHRHATFRSEDLQYPLQMQHSREDFQIPFRSFRRRQKPVAQQVSPFSLS